MTSAEYRRMFLDHAYLLLSAARTDRRHGAGSRAHTARLLTSAARMRRYAQREGLYAV
jgi:hypothetical protein